MTNLPISNIINVNIADMPSGAPNRSVNIIALFTTEPLNILDDYGQYVSAQQVAEDAGTSSVTAAMASAIFAQSPNILSGGGRLVVVPLLNAVSATSGTFTSANITANLASLIAVNNGDLKVTVDGVAYNLTGINLTNCVTFADIAAVIQKKLLNATVTATVNGLLITSKKVGTVSTVALAAVSGGTGTALNGAGYLNATAGTSSAGVNSSGEKLVDAITRISDQVFFTGVITNLRAEDAVIVTTANFIQSRDLIYAENFLSTADNDGVIKTIQQAGNKKTRCLLYTTSPAQSNLMKAAYAGGGFSTDFTGSDTSSTRQLKVLKTITPDAGISQSIYEASKVSGADLYVSIDGVPSIISNGANDYFDNPYSDLALKFALQTAGFNFLRQTNTKIPQTESGMSGLKDAYAQVCEQFIRNGAMAPGEWNSSETFGDPETFRQNIRDRGYYIYSTPISQQSAADRDGRKAPLVQIAIKRAGAIHTSDVLVIINN